MRKIAIGLALSVSLGALSAPAFAQTAGNADEASPKKDDKAANSDIVVTAERREQNLQDYAGTAAAFTGDDLKKRGIQDISDLNEVLPGLTVANNGPNREVWIRGVGSSNNTELGDPAAATHWDGVYLPRPSGIGSAFFDIQRVEVNVGPQGTLRGRNATAGSVNVVTWKPGLGVWDAELEGEYGNYNQKSVHAMVNVPLGDSAALRVSGMGLSHDSYFKNVGPVREVGGAEAEDNVAGRVQLLWKPSERWRFLLAGDYMHEQGSGWTGANFANPLGNGIDPASITRPRDVISRAFTPDLDIMHWGVRLEVSFDAGPFKIDYLGSYRHVKADYNAATPISPNYPGVLSNLAQLPGTLSEELDNWSRFESLTDSKSQFQELRLHNDKGPLIWNLGANFFKEDQYAFLGATGDRGLFFQGIEFNMPDVNAKSYGLYGDLTWSVSNHVRLTGGVRYTDDRKSREGVAARYGFAIGDGNFNCCGGVRVGTEGFLFAGKGRTIFNPDANGDGVTSDQEVINFYFNGVKQFGSRDTINTLFANGPIPGHFGTVPGVPLCQDTITGDFWTCQGFEPSGQYTYAVPFQGQIFRQSGKMHQHFVDWRARLEADISDHSLVYALVTTGHKSGGFNDNLGDLGVAPTYAPEKVTLYELGSKNEFELGSSRLRLNGTLFLNDYRDQVLTSILSVSQVVNLSGIPLAQLPSGTNQALVVSYSYNAAQSRIWGFNLEGGIKLPSNINLTFNALWLDAKVTKSRQIEDFRFQADVSPAEAILQPITGKRLPRTPAFQFNASFAQSFGLGHGSADYVISAGYRSSQFMTIFNSQDFQNPSNPRLRLNDRVPGYWTFDLGVGYSVGDNNKFRIEAYANNLTNTTHPTAIIITQFDNTRFFNRPRTFGARIRLKY